MTTTLTEVEPGVAERRPTGRPLTPRPRHGAIAVLLGLQRSAGNAAVSREVARQRSVLLPRPPGTLPVVQRCGPVPCDCTPDERAEHERKHSTENEQDEAKASSVQRELVGSGAVTVQRHSGWRTKPRLEVPELDPLQYAASRTDRALEFGRAQNPVEVTRLQEGLTRAGYALPLTGKYDAATRSAVSKFQASHGIPYPTGPHLGPDTAEAADRSHRTRALRGADDDPR